MRLKLINVLGVIAFMLVLCANVYAATPVIDVNIYEEKYVQSESKEIESIYANTVQQAVVYDTNVDHSGFTYSGSTIDVRPGAYMKGVQLFMSADTLKIAGEVENLAAYSQNIVISGIVHGDMAIYANSVYIKDTAVIEGDVLVYAPILEVDGTINGNLLAKVSNSTKITGTVKGQVKLITTALSMENETLEGDIYIETNTDYTALAKKYPEATFKTIQVEDNTLDNIQAIIIDGVVIVLVCTLLTVLATLKGKDFMLKLAEKVRTNIVSVVLYGSLIPILSIIIVPLLLIMVMFHMGIISWPMLISYALLLSMAYVLRILIFGMAIASVVVNVANKKHKEENDKDENKKSSIIKPILLTLLLYVLLYTLTKLPVVASYANMLMFIISLGIIVTWFMKTNRLTIKK